MDNDSFHQEMMAHVPLFLHPNPSQVLIIGGGNGGSTREILRHTTVQKCVLIDHDESVTTSCKGQSPRLKTVTMDAHEWIKDSTEKFEVICINASLGNEIYSSLKKNLATGGILISKAGSPIFSENEQLQLASSIKQQFRRVHFYNYTHPSALGGLTSLAYATDSIHPMDDFSRSKVLSSGLEFSYYNLGIHEGSFLIPEFQKKNLVEFLNPL